MDAANMKELMWMLMRVRWSAAKMGSVQRKDMTGKIAVKKTMQRWIAARMENVQRKDMTGKLAAKRKMSIKGTNINLFNLVLRYHSGVLLICYDQNSKIFISVISFINDSTFSQSPAKVW
jgi:hypothetical protein